MAKIQKVRIELTLLVEAASPEAAANEVTAMSLDQIAEAIDDGPMIGATQLIDVTPVEDDDVDAESQALGSDSSFFGHLFEDEA